METKQSVITKQQLIDLAYERVFTKLVTERHYHLVSLLGATIHCGRLTVTRSNMTEGDCLLFQMPTKKSALGLIHYAYDLFIALHEVYPLVELRISTIQKPLRDLRQPDCTCKGCFEIAPGLYVNKVVYTRHNAWLTLLKAG